jgi:hypothetical protein
VDEGATPQVDEAVVPEPVVGDYSATTTPAYESPLEVPVQDGAEAINDTVEAPGIDPEAILPSPLIPGL